MKSSRDRIFRPSLIQSPYFFLNFILILKKIKQNNIGTIYFPRGNFVLNRNCSIVIFLSILRNIQIIKTSRSQGDKKNE